MTLNKRAIWRLKKRKYNWKRKRNTKIPEGKFQQTEACSTALVGSELPWPTLGIVPSAANAVLRFLMIVIMIIDFFRFFERINGMKRDGMPRWVRSQHSRFWWVRRCRDDAARGRAEGAPRRGPAGHPPAPPRRRPVLHPPRPLSVPPRGASPCTPWPSQPLNDGRRWGVCGARWCTTKRFHPREEGVTRFAEAMEAVLRHGLTPRKLSSSSSSCTLPLPTRVVRVPWV